jgi:CRISPR-associated exonuclease Cas4
VIPALILVLLGALAVFWAGRRRRAAGLPSGRVVYMDMRDVDRQRTALFDPGAQLTGRPDYLVDSGGSRIPVEVKSARAPVVPYRGHILQVAAYCYLTEAVFGVRPTHGILRYQDRSVAIDYTPDLENEMLDVLAQMRRQEALELSRSHTSANRCRACGYRAECDQSLI